MLMPVRADAETEFKAFGRRTKSISRTRRIIEYLMLRISAHCNDPQLVLQWNHSSELVKHMDDPEPNTAIAGVGMTRRRSASY